MNRLYIIVTLVMITLYSYEARAALNLNIKINQTIGDKVIEVVKTITGNYNQDIEIQDGSLKNRIILNLKKFKNIAVNGNKIDPVQIDLKLVNEMKKTIGKPYTVTSFYSNSAEFTLPNQENLILNFEETN